MSMVNKGQGVCQMDEPDKFTLIELIENSFDKYGELIAFQQGKGKGHKYKELEADVKGLANSLRRLGLKIGQKCVIAGRDTYTSLVIALGTIFAGGVTAGPAHLANESLDELAVEIGRFTGGKIMGQHQHRRGQLRDPLAVAAQQVAEQPLLDVEDVVGPLGQVGTLQLLKDVAVAA